MPSRVLFHHPGLAVPAEREAVALLPAFGLEEQ